MTSAWQATGDIPPLDGALTRDVLARLGLAQVAATVAGLTTLYAGWRRALGMENLSKRVRLLEHDDPLDAIVTPEQTFDGFLAQGTSGTCWPTMEALVALAKACGFDARPRAGEMTRPGRTDHGAVVVVIDGTEYSVDPNLLWPAPLRLDRTEATRLEGPFYDVEASYDVSRMAFTIRSFSGAHQWYSTVLLDGELSREDYAPFYARAMHQSYFNAGYFVNRQPDGVWRQLDTTRYREVVAGGQAQQSTPPADLPAFIEQKFGVSSALVARLLELERASLVT